MKERPVVNSRAANSKVGQKLNLRAARGQGASTARPASKQGANGRRCSLWLLWHWTGAKTYFPACQKSFTSRGSGHPAPWRALLTATSVSIWPSWLSRLSDMTRWWRR